MKCDKCFFCTHIGSGIFASYPVKYCKRTGEYKIPFVETHEDGKLIKRQLDFRNKSDLKIWSDIGCDINPNTVKRAKGKAMKELEALMSESENDEC